MITVSQAARSKDLTRQHLAKLCKQGRIPGAQFLYGLWLLPEKFTITPVRQGRPKKDAT